MNKHDIVKLMKEVKPTVSTVEFLGEKVAILPYLDINQRAGFIAGAVEACMEDPTHAFGIFTYIFRASLVEYYTDIDLGINETAEDNHMLEKLLFGTNIIYLICENTADNIRELRDECFAALAARKQADESPLNLILRNIEKWIENIGADIADTDVKQILNVVQSMEDIDPDKLAVAIEKRIINGLGEGNE